MRDFTTRIYRKLLLELKVQGYIFQTFQDFLQNPAEKVVVIRHDVDDRKRNSLHFAYIENAFGIQTTYNFRILPKSFDPVIVDLIRNLGHEIGYHYEDLTLAKGDKNKAIELFEKHLSELRHFYPVKTICMHGSPLSRFDNREIWNHYNYRDFGIIGEPYFDVDYNNVLYLTDTGRTWNNSKLSVRDKAPVNFDLSFKSTMEIIKRIDQLPDRVMFNFHPQRWDDNPFRWMRELVYQNIKNVVKRYFFVKNRYEE